MKSSCKIFRLGIHIFTNFYQFLIFFRVLESVYIIEKVNTLPAESFRFNWKNDEISKFFFVAKSSTRTVEVRCKNSLTKRLQRTCGNTACNKSTCHCDLERQISGRMPVLCCNILDINDLWKPFKWIYYQNISKSQMESLQCS